MLAEITALGWAALAAGALLVGVSKTALPGVNTVSVALFAAVLPARASTGALLLLLMLGDVFALWAYRRHAHWPTLIRMIPAVLAGVGLGTLFLAVAGDGAVKRVIAVLLLLLTALTLWSRRRRDASPAPGQDARGAAAGYGCLGGFTTMVANSGGPVMSLYFLAARFPVQAFLGTAAWFFATVNVIKLPISIGLGLVTPETLTVDLWLAPLVVVGALLGRVMAGRMRQEVFDRAVLALTVLGALYLLL